MEKIKIAKQKVVPISALVENPNNPKTITEANFLSLVRSLEEDPGFLESQDILVYEDGNDNGYHIIGGNHRVKALRMKGVKEVAVTIYDVMTDGVVDEKKLWSAILLHGAHYGRYDLEKLFDGFDKEMLRELDLPQINTILLEVEEVKEEKHTGGQNKKDYDFTASGSQLIKLFFSPEEKSEIEGYYNLNAKDEAQSLSDFILYTL